MELASLAVFACCASALALSWAARLPGLETWAGVSQTLLVRRRIAFLNAVGGSALVIQTSDSHPALFFIAVALAASSYARLAQELHVISRLRSLASEQEWPLHLPLGV